MAPKVGANIKNAKGDKTFKTHHCSECKKAPMPQCFKKLHITYCEECDMKFNVISPTGCYEHKYADGYNRRVQNQRRGLDADHKTSWDLIVEARVKEAEEEAARVEAEVAATRAAAPQYKEKRPPPQKTKVTQGRKQQKPQDFKSLRATEKKGKNI